MSTEEAKQCSPSTDPGKHRYHPRTQSLICEPSPKTHPPRDQIEIFFLTGPSFKINMEISDKTFHHPHFVNKAELQVGLNGLHLKAVLWHCTFFSNKPRRLNHWSNCHLRKMGGEKITLASELGVVAVTVNYDFCWEAWRDFILARCCFLQYVFVRTGDTNPERERRPLQLPAKLKYYSETWGLDPAGQ